MGSPACSPVVRHAGFTVVAPQVSASGRFNNLRGWSLRPLSFVAPRPLHSACGGEAFETSPPSCLQCGFALHAASAASCQSPRSCSPSLQLQLMPNASKGDDSDGSAGSAGVDGGGDGKRGGSWKGEEGMVRLAEAFFQATTKESVDNEDILPQEDSDECALSGDRSFRRPCRRLGPPTPHHARQDTARFPTASPLTRRHEPLTR